MPVSVGWTDIAIRLGSALLASGVIGLNRGEHGRSAGLRTTILVALAATASMIQVNLLLPLSGKASDSFIVMDLMRLPLGILSGMGFIGAGAILRRGKLVLGVTTAATLWFITTMGLCFGGGQLGLGWAMFALGAVVLWVLKWFEQRMDQDHRSILILKQTAEGPSEAEIREQLAGAGVRVIRWGLSYSEKEKKRRVCCEVQWRSPPAETNVPMVIYQLAAQPGITELKWRP